MQHKALMYGVGAVAVVIVGLGAWVVIGKSPSPSSSTEKEQPPQTQNTTLKNLFAMGGSNKCTFTSSTENSQSRGTIFITGKQMRGDFSSVAAGNTIESHMIVKDNKSYLWNDATPQGFMMSFDAVATQSGTNSQGSVDPNAQVEYSCAPWSNNPGAFEIPTNVTFRDMSSMIPNGVR